jgi:peroxiredoxin (alkyl hydroperoxide reductase subunit C)
MSISVGQKAPDFTATAMFDEEFLTVKLSDYLNKKYLILFFYPLDFTFVCPTEIAEFNKRFYDFADRDTVLYGASTDSEFVHAAWRNNHDDLRGLKFPMLADTSKELSDTLGILTADERVAYRVTYLVDPQGIIRWVSANDLSVGRNVDEVLRVLDALQTDELCPCNWKAGDATL